MSLNVNNLVIPYNDFQLGTTIEPAEFIANNNAIMDTVNSIVSILGTIPDPEDAEQLPGYISDTYISGVEIRSPIITGNTLVGGTGMVGMSSAGSTGTSTRIWAGSTNKDTAPFRVTQDGRSYLSSAVIKTSDANRRVEFNSGGISSYNTSGEKHGFELDINGALNLYRGTSATSEKIASIKYDNAGSGFDTQNRLFIDTFGGYALKLRSTGGISFESNDIWMQGRVLIPSSHQLLVGATSAPSTYRATINGNLNVIGDIYVNGVKMKLTPA